jgi:hypothetical protein
MHNDTITLDPAVFEKAADVLDGGWCRGAYRQQRSQGQFSYCLVGALMKARRDLHPGAVSSIAYEAEVRKAVGTSPEGWNDSQRDKRKVQRLLRRIARNMRKAGK